LFAAFIYVALIMPEGIGSGKPRKTMPMRVFPLSGMRHFMRTSCHASACSND
jgi:hypothetical protein